MSKQKKKKNRPEPPPSPGDAPLEPDLLPLESPRNWRHTLAFAIAAGLFFLSVQYLRYPDVALSGKLYFLDPDSYTWLNRAERVLYGPDLYVHHHPSDNFPGGYTSHWTQPFHWVLALFSLALRPFAEGRAPLEAAGVWVCPLFGALTLGLLAGWAFRRWPWFVALLTVLVFLVNPYEHWTFSLGRPDHQCLLVFFLLAAVLLLLDMDRYSTRRRLCLAASGVLTAAGIWVSVQGLSLWALLLSALVLRAALAPVEERRDRLSDALRWAGFAAAACLLFTLIERQGRLFTVISDSISIGQVLLLAVPVLVLAVTERVCRKRRGRPGAAWFFAVVALPAVLTGLATLWLFSRQSSEYDLATLDAMGRWFSNNLEFLPALFFVNGEMMLGRLHDALGYTLYAIPFLIFGLVRTRLLDRTGKWILGAGVVAASLLILWQMRWRDLHSLLFAPFFAVGITGCAAAMLPFTGLGKKSPKKRRLFLGLVSFLAGAILLWPWISTSLHSYQGTRKPRLDYIALRKICEWIRENDPRPPGPGGGLSEGGNVAVLAVRDQGPMVRYWSGRPVVAGPYHRNMEGILDTMRAFTARTRSDFEKIASERRIQYVVRPPPPPFGDSRYAIYTFEWITGEKDPLLAIRREQVTPDRSGTAREYGLRAKKTTEMLNGTLRKRLEDNLWNGWPGLQPVEVPGLEKMLPDAELFPYLYRR